MKKFNAAIQCCFYDVPKMDNVSQYSRYQGPFTDIKKFIGYREHQINNLKLKNVYPENLYNEHHAQNRVTSNNHKTHQCSISKMTNKNLDWNGQLRGRYDLNDGRFRYNKRREHTVNITDQYSVCHRDKSENTNYQYQKGHHRPKTHTSLYHYSVCGDHCRHCGLDKCKEYSKIAIRFTNDLQFTIGTIQFHVLFPVSKRRSACTITSQKTLVSTGVSKIVVAIPTIYKGSRKLKMDAQSKY